MAIAATISRPFAALVDWRRCCGVRGRISVSSVLLKRGMSRADDERSSASSMNSEGATRRNGVKSVVSRISSNSSRCTTGDLLFAVACSSESTRLRESFRTSNLLRRITSVISACGRAWFSPRVRCSSKAEISLVVTKALSGPRDVNQNAIKVATQGRGPRGIVS